MHKSEVLEGVKAMLASGELSKEELLEVVQTIDQGTVQRPGVAPKHRFNLAEVLYYIGGGIVALGVAVLIGDNWRALNSVTRVIATLGVALAAYATAVVLSLQGKTKQVAQAFYFICGVLLPVGLGVTFHEAGYQVGSILFETIIVGIAFAFFFSSFWLMKRSVVLIFAIIYGVVLFFAVTSYMTQGLPQFANSHFTEYRFAVVGLTLMLLGYGFHLGQYKSLAGSLYSFGVISFLSALLALGGFKPGQNIYWEIAYPGVVFGIILLSIYIKSKSFLTFGAIFLMAYILKITAEYFTNSLGWPLALVVAGLALIGIGYITVFVNKRYLVRATPGALPGH